MTGLPSLPPQASAPALNQAHIFQVADNTVAALSENSSHQNSSDFTKLRVYYQNVRGLRTKVDSFYLAAIESEYDVVVLTETWLDDCILSTQLFGDGFTVFRTDRCPLNSRKTRGGGVLIAVSSRFCCHIDQASISNSLEQLWVKITLQNCYISVGVIYLPPDRRNDLDLIQRHVDSIESVLSGLNPCDTILQFGDYNHPEMRWIPSEYGGLKLDAINSRVSAAGAALYDGFCFHGLTQINTFDNFSSRILDLVLLNDTALPICQISEAMQPSIDNNASFRLP